MHQQAQDVVELRQPRRRVAEAMSPAAIDVPVAVKQAIKQAAQILLVRAHERGWEVLLVALAELAQHPRPLQGIQVDVDDRTVNGRRRADTSHPLDRTYQLVDDGGLVRAEIPR